MARTNTVHVLSMGFLLDLKLGKLELLVLFINKQHTYTI